MPFLSTQDFLKLVRLNLRTAVPTPLLGLDLGTQCVGVAISDPRAQKAYVLGSFATRKQNILVDHSFHNYIMQHVQNHKIKGIVVGFPTGNPSLCAFFVKIIEHLQFNKGLECPVVKHSEECTTSASRLIAKTFDEMYNKRELSGDKTLGDQLAALLILQSFLDVVHNMKEKTEPEEE